MSSVHRRCQIHHAPVIRIARPATTANRVCGVGEDALETCAEAAIVGTGSTGSANVGALGVAAGLTAAGVEAAALEDTGCSTAVARAAAMAEISASAADFSLRDMAIVGLPVGRARM